MNIIIIIYKQNDMKDNNIFLLAVDFELQYRCEFNKNKIEFINIYNKIYL